MQFALILFLIIGIVSIIQIKLSRNLKSNRGVLHMKRRNYESVLEIRPHSSRWYSYTCSFVGNSI